MEPQPGEVWVITEPHFGPESWDRIHDYGPFVVTYIAASYIGFVTSGPDVEPKIGHYPRGQWDWLKHATRIWPPLPTWEELEAANERHADDLRAQRVAGVA